MSRHSLLITKTGYNIYSSNVCTVLFTTTFCSTVVPFLTDEMLCRLYYSASSQYCQQWKLQQQVINRNPLLSQRAHAHSIQKGMFNPRALFLWLFYIVFTKQTFFSILQSMQRNLLHLLNVPLLLCVVFFYFLSYTLNLQ